MTTRNTPELETEQEVINYTTKKIKQPIKIGDHGAREIRVLESLTPLVGDGVPKFAADYVGQFYVRTGSKPELYVSVKTGSSTSSEDWKKVTLA